MPRCLGTTLEGKRCKNKVTNKGYCSLHGTSICSQKRAKPVLKLPKCPAKPMCVVPGRRKNVPRCSRLTLNL